MPKCSHPAHGILYICPEYPQEEKDRIRGYQKQFTAQCFDGSINIKITKNDGTSETKTWREWIDSTDPEFIRN